MATQKGQNPKENQLEILGISSREFTLELFTLCWKFSRGPPVQESAAGAMYLSLRIHSKSCLISPLKVAATLLSVQEKVQLEHS